MVKYQLKRKMCRVLILTVLTVSVYSTDIKQRLENPPVPVKNFNLNAYLGKWFLQFRKAQCTWPGSSSFTDFEQNPMPDGKKGISNRMTWRSGGTCNTATGRFFITAPGEFHIEDNMGDTHSGRLIVVATDYKTFVIYWGCTRMLGSGTKCVDPWLSVGTRQRFPPKPVVNMIENILRFRWGITIGELQKVPHTTPCQPKKCKY